MRVRALSPTLDFTFGQGEQNYIANSPATVAQCVFTALQLLLGEWYLNTAAGVPWLTQVIGFGTKGSYDTVIKNAILGVQAVTEILSYSSTLNGTTLEVSDVVVATIYGVSVSLPTIGIPLAPTLGWGNAPYGESGVGV